MDYPITLERDDDGNVVVRFTDFPEARAVGAYEADARARAREMLAGILAAYVKDRRAIPAPSPRGGAALVSLPVLLEAKVAVYEAMRASGISRADLARRLRWHRPQVDRLLNMRHGSKLDQLETALAVLGKRITLEVKDLVGE